MLDGQVDLAAARNEIEQLLITRPREDASSPRVLPVAAGPAQ
jgi:hypothetical protein